MRRHVLRALAAAVVWPAGQSWAVYGGLPAQRPDQQVPSSGAGVAPGTASGTFRGRQVVIFGTGPGSGLFVYNGTPALGNAPQVAIVPSAVTADPFGNAITSSKILLRGNVITESGGVFRTAPTSPLIQLDGPHNAYLQYDTGIHLSETIAPAVTSDGLGNTVQSGFTSYGAGGIYAQLQAAVLTFVQSGNVANPGLSASTGQLVATSGTIAGSTVAARLSLIPGATVAIADLAHAALLIEETVSPGVNGAGAVLYGPAGQLRYVSDSTNGDSNDYALGTSVKIATSTPQTVNSTTGQAVTGLTWNVAANTTYLFEAQLFCTVGPNALLPAAAVTGPGTSFCSLEIEGVDTKHGSLATALGGGNQVAMGALTNYVNNGTIPVGDTFTCKVRGRFTTTAAGTVGISVSTSAGANTYTVNNGSYGALSPG